MEGIVCPVVFRGLVGGFAAAGCLFFCGVRWRFVGPARWVKGFLGANEKVVHCPQGEEKGGRGK
jgi:hypothetical protein